MRDLRASHGTSTYTVARDGDELLVTRAVCGPSRPSRAAAEVLVDPVVGIERPPGRFQTKASESERTRLAGLLRGELARWPS